MATLTAQKRKENNIGKKFAKQIRSKGQVPAVIYGQNQDPISISLDPVDFLKKLSNSEYQKNIVFTIEIDGDKSEKVITKEINVNPINNQFIHIDFLRVTDESSIHINVPIVIEGIAAGQRLGGVLVKQKSEVKVLCLPSEIPINIKIDITKLGIGDNFRVKDIVSNSAITILSNPKDILVKVESTKLSKTAMQGDGSADLGGQEAAVDGAENNAETSNKEN